MKTTSARFAVAILFVSVSYGADFNSSPLTPPTTEGVASVATTTADNPNSRQVAVSPNSPTAGPYRCHYSIAVNGGFPQFTICSVPAGYRFVIEQVSTYMQLANTSRVDFFWIRTTIGGKPDVDFIPFEQKVVTQYATRYQTLHQVKMYADGGTNIVGAMQGTFNYQTDGLWITLTGYLEQQ